MLDLSQFHGPNAGYVLELYDRYLSDPASVDAATRALFSRWSPLEAVAREPGPLPFDPAAVARAADLAEAIRERGHLAARLDPLGQPRPEDPVLAPTSDDRLEPDLARLPASIVGGPAGAANALEALRTLRDLYEGTTGYEFGHVVDPVARLWLRDAVESRRFAGPLGVERARDLLVRLSQVEALERFLHRTFPGQTRFSLEGTDALVPMLDEVVAGAAEAGICEIVIGMAHRGRLNVLAHVLGKPYEAIIAGFQGGTPSASPAPTPPDMDCPGWMGDVKYHLGGRRAYSADHDARIVIKLAPNPSHLESVNPVVEGMVRAADEERGAPGRPKLHENAALAVLIHGDAAFPGQGIVAETLNLSRLSAYQTGGTIHVLVNNQLGFTAEPAQTRSTRYASDLAKGFEIPIVHVNADDPPACLAAMRLAFAYRQRFHRDFLVELIGYRRWGHNEGDEPAFTQPRLYALIASHPTVRELWAGQLERRGIVSRAAAEEMQRTSYERLQAARRRLAEHPELAGQEQPCGPDRRDEACAEAEEVETAVPADRLAELNDHLASLPAGFRPDPKLERLLRRRAEALGDGGRIDWAHAETLALGSILADGVPIRLTGQDTARGTFSQRHAVVHDRATGERYVPLQALPEARASFEVEDSPLSEAAAVGFEYGYSVEAPGALVIWEAQYGDFANGAQVQIDQFLMSGRAKWGQEPALVLLLPHGYEGQGPEHSSARLERFLQLAAPGEVWIAVPTTAAQHFHLLRRHAALLRCAPRPLIALTPKSLLRNPAAASRLDDLASGRFHAVLGDERAGEGAREVTRLVLCSGKVYYDLPSGEARPPEVAVARIEQLYPFPEAAVARIIASYPALREVVWLQEEPQNMGAWAFVEPRLRALAPAGAAVRYVGRPVMASPAEGSPERHAVEQARLVREALAAVEERARGLRRAS